MLKNFKTYTNTRNNPNRIPGWVFPTSGSLRCTAGKRGVECVFHLSAAGASHRRGRSFIAHEGRTLSSDFPGMEKPWKRIWCRGPQAHRMEIEYPRGV